MKQLPFRVSPSVGLPALLLCGVVLAHLNHVTQTDLFLWLNHTCSLWLGAQIWPALTLLGNTVVLLCMITPLLLLEGRIVVGLVAAIPAGGLSSAGLKWVFSAPRPGDVLDPNSFHVLGGLLSGDSFPSGHTITAFAAAGVVFACMRRVRPLRAAQVLLIGLTMVLAALVGLSRIAVGAHWPMDVMAGACIGWLAGLSGVALMEKFPAFFASPRMSWAILLTLFACCAHLANTDFSEPYCRELVLLAITLTCLTMLAKTLARRSFRFTQLH